MELTHLDSEEASKYVLKIQSQTIISKKINK